ncbi:MAG: exosome complex RNA-binding protein Rrp4 [Candidatus Pacearchaeota archaeon]|nr:exosome complex RNA-binding protein Rrp4 [Candidatus Pacearchaeota archaeon]
MTEKQRQIVIPGEEIAKGNDYLPGENTEKRGDAIVALRYGLSEESNKLVRVIPLSGVYHPRRGNSVIGKVIMVTFNGWVIDIGASDNAFLSLMEVPRFVNKDNLEEVLEIGDMLNAKIWAINKRGIDLSIKQRGFGKIEEGIITRINPNKVPRLIGKEGSMINIIKENTGCNITVGQNGIIWIKADKVEDELFARRAIEFIESKSYISGLTDEVTKWFGENKK